jgi:imidazole glycerol-phosphate synthase subunit HisH
MKKAVIIDYQLGNLFSVRQALESIGLNAVISSTPSDIEMADAVVLPGVGAFKDAMNNLHIQGMVQPIHDYINSGKPFMGVCLGLQLLFTESEEFGASKGLNILPGKVKRFENENLNGGRIKVPQISWNQIYPSSIDWSKTPLRSVKENEHMYFVHSYYVEPVDSSCVLSLTTYHDKVYTSAVYKKNIFACQFHPEKSAKKGLMVYKDWAILNQLI